MKKSILNLKQFNLLLNFFMILLLQNVVFAQEGDSGFNNGEWQKRAFPKDSISQDSYRNAIQQQQQKNSAIGYYLSSPLVWSPIGPTIDGSGAGRIAFVKYDHNNNNIIYVAAHGGGVWKSIDNGAHFTALDAGYQNGSLPTQTSGSLCIDPNNSNIIYYATGGVVENFYLYNYYGLGVFKSTNGGSSWTGGYNTGLPAQTYSFRILVNPGNSNIVYLAENQGLYLSNDAGVTWNKAVDIRNQPIIGSCQDVVTSNDGNTVYAIGGHSAQPWYRWYFPDGIGYWKSNNAGAYLQANDDIAAGICVPLDNTVKMNIEIAQILAKPNAKTLIKPKEVDNMSLFG